MKKYLEIFKGFNIVLIIGVIIWIKNYYNISISELIERLMNNIDLSVKKGGIEATLHGEFKRSKDYEISKMQSDTREEAKEQILDNTNKKNYCDRTQCGINEIAVERDNLRYFAAYQVTNGVTRELLKKVLISNKMGVEEFSETVMNYYRKNIRNMGKRRREEFAERKLNELIYNLQYLNIIEYTEDDMYIILTKDGTDFVRGYTEGVG